MTDRRSRTALRSLTWLSMSLATALTSHAVIDILAGTSGGHAHERYAHGAVVPLLFIASVLGSTALLWAAMRRAGNAGGIDPVLALAEDFEAAHPVLSCAAVAAGGIAGLIAMEFCEQFAEFGYVEGVGDALGGNVLFGIAAVAFAASIATLLVKRCANSIVATAAATIVRALSWFLGFRRSVADRATILRSRPQRNETRISARFTRSFGLRAPPAPLRLSTLST